MIDAIYADARLVAIYDAVDGDRGDLDAYAAVVEEFGARRVLDVGCGTGAFAVLLARRGIEVTGTDPAAASVAYAEARPGGDRVDWLEGDATTLPPMVVDLVTMTGNVAQSIVEPADWTATLHGCRAALRPGGRLVFETRDPARRAWEGWTRADTERVVQLDGAGEVTTWIDLTEVHLPLIRFRQTWVFAVDGAVLTSDSTLRFRERDELAADLSRAGFAVDEVRDAPDRPGREFVVVAHVENHDAAGPTARR